MGSLKIKQVVSARIPIPEAQCCLFYYSNNQDDKEHLALVIGDVCGRRNVLVRLHSECFTGDVIRSLRCDCGSQLQLATQMISWEGQGVILYLRQEGRGIGLRDKLLAYNLQDLGYDTVDANLRLGHEADERDYEIAAAILEDLGVYSVRLLTNNPSKIEGLKSFGVEVASREPLQPQVTSENLKYLTTKAMRMGHLLDLSASLLADGFAQHNDASHVHQPCSDDGRMAARPSVTLTYAQSLDGCIAQSAGAPMRLSGPESSKMTHRLRAGHDAILVGIGTVIADNPSLSVRLVEGPDPQPVILDSRLRLPLEANLLRNRKVAPWVATTELASDDRRKELERAGARVICLPSTSKGWVHLPALLEGLAAEGISSVMVEGGAKVITSFLSERLIDHLVLTIAPVVVGGLRAVGDLESLPTKCPRLKNMNHQRLGDDLVVWGEPDWRED
jgi:GTP cyclohydrolase II